MQVIAHNVRVSNPETCTATFDELIESHQSGNRIRLLRDQVLVRLIAPERMTASKLLWIPANARRADYEVFHGVVVAAGPGAVSKWGVRTPCDVKPGDRVVFYFFAAEEALAWPDKDHLLISENWIQYREEA